MADEVNNTQQQQNVVDTGEANITTNTTGATANINNSANQSADPDQLLNSVANEGNNQQDTQQQNGNTDTNALNQQMTQAQQTLNAAEKDLEGKGVDFKALENEFQTTGALSADSYNKLANAGYPKEVVDGVLNGWQAAADNYVSAVTNIAGGQDELTRIQDFVRSQPKEVMDAYNAAINSENIGQIKLVFDGIRSLMTKTYGTANPTVMGSTGGAGIGVTGYETTEEMVKDMSDPRYQKDMKFTREVYQKVKNAKFF